MYFRLRLNEKGRRPAYRLNIEKVRYQINSYIWIKLEGDILMLRNTFTGVYHKFLDGKDYHQMTRRSYLNLIKKIEQEFEKVDWQEPKN